MVRVDLMLPMAHGSTEPPAGTHRLDVRDAVGVDRTCWPASTRSATRLPSSAPG